MTEKNKARGFGERPRSVLLRIGSYCLVFDGSEISESGGGEK